jgi:hypothetical protein
MEREEYPVGVNTGTSNVFGHPTPVHHFGQTGGFGQPGLFCQPAQPESFGRLKIQLKPNELSF